LNNDSKETSERFFLSSPIQEENEYLETTHNRTLIIVYFDEEEKDPNRLPKRDEKWKPTTKVPLLRYM